MLPTEDLFVHLYVLVDDVVADGAVAIPPRPGPVPACSDAEVLTVALARHLPGRRSEAGSTLAATRSARAPVSVAFFIRPPCRRRSRAVG